MADVGGDCSRCDYKRGMANPRHGVKIPGVGKCTRPGGHCPEYHYCKSEGKIMSEEAQTQEVLEKDDQRVVDLGALEKELKEFSGGLAYDQARIIERTQDDLKEGVTSFYRAGLGLVLLERHEGVQTFAQILDQNFPGISLRSAYNYMAFARNASKLPNFKQFCLERGGWSKGLTMLQACTEAEMENFEVSGELRGYSREEISRMSVRTLQKALLKAGEKTKMLVEKATDKVLAENVKLREENEGLKAALLEPDVQAAFKIIREAEKKFMEGAALLRKITPELLEREETVRNLAFASAGMLGRITTQMEWNAQEALNRSLAAEGDEDD